MSEGGQGKVAPNGAFAKSELGIPLLEIEKELAKQRSATHTVASNEAFAKSTENVSKQIGVSRGTFERAKKIIEKAPEELKEKVRTGQTLRDEDIMSLGTLLLQDMPFFLH